MSRNPLYDAIYGLENQTWRAMQKTGADLLPFLSRDCIMLFPLGLKVTARTEPNLVDVMTSKAFIPWKSYEMRDVEVMPIGTEAAIISYAVEAVRFSLDGDGEAEPSEPFRGLLSSTWRFDRDSGKWLMCFHQQTPFQIV